MSEDKMDKMPAPPKKAAGGTPKSTSITLKDSKANTFRIAAVIKKDGTVTTYVVHRELGPDGKTKSTTRGATQQHENMDAARGVMDKIKKKAVAAGWQERVSRVGHAKPDDFDVTHLPVAKS
jgi:hypothetical protein